MADRCVFCEIVAGREPATVVHRWPNTIVIVPLNPVTEGHLLVIPREHVEDAATSPSVTALTFARAAEIAERPFNLITSAGREATQSVFHLHVHVLPRRKNDGLALPWHSGSGRAESVRLCTQCQLSAGVDRPVGDPECPHKGQGWYR